MKIIKFILIAIILISCQFLKGGYSSEYRWLNVGASGQLQYKDGFVLSASNRAIYIATVSGNITAPLTNNVGVGDGDNILNEGVQSAHQVGGTKGNPDSIVLGDGKIWATSGTLSSASKGFVRFFSTNTIIGSAYYGNSDVWDYTDPIPELLEGQTLQTSIVNPAYNIPLSGSSSYTNSSWTFTNFTSGTLDIDISGLLGIGSGNNQLSNDNFSAGGFTWTNDQGYSGNIDVDSSWSDQITVKGAIEPAALTNEITIRVVADSARTGLPFAEYTFYVIGQTLDVALPAVGWSVTNVLDNIAQDRDGSRTITNTFRCQDEDAQLCEVDDFEYSFDGTIWTPIPSASFSGDTNNLISNADLTSAQSYSLVWNASDQLGNVETNGYLRMRISDADDKASEWGVGSFDFDGIVTDFSIVSPNSGADFVTNSGAGALWDFSGIVETFSVVSNLVNTDVDYSGSGINWTNQILMSEGVNQIIFIANDAFGNIATLTQTVTITSLPAVGSSITNVLDAIGQFTDGSKMITNMFRCKDGDSQLCKVDAVEYSFNGTDWIAIPFSSVSGETNNLASNPVLSSAPAQSLTWSAADQLGDVETNGYLRMRISDSDDNQTAWAVGSFSYDGVVTDFSISIPNNGADVVTNSGDGVNWNFAGIVEANSDYVVVSNINNNASGIYTGSATSWAVINDILIEGGLNQIVAVARDAFGNIAVLNQNITVTTNVAPKIEIYFPDNNSTMPTNYIPVFGIAMDDANGSVVSMTINGTPITGEFYPWHIPAFGPLAVGSNLITVTATDDLGAVGVATVVVYYEEGITNSLPPIIRIVNPIDKTVSSTSNIVVSGFAMDDYGIAEVTLNGLTVSPPDMPSFWKTPLNLEIGANTIVALARDVSGLYATNSITVYYDPDTALTNVSPSITIQNPINNSTSVTEWVLISGIASDDVNLKSVFVNGTEAIGLNQWNLYKMLEPGSNAITAVVTDNEELTDSDTIIVYYSPITPETNNPPTITIINPDNAITSSTEKITVSGTASDDFNLTLVKINGQMVTDLKDWSIELSLQEGSNLIEAVATDNEGLTGIDSIIIYYDPSFIPPNIPPTISILNPLDGTTSSMEKVTISGIANDDVSLADVKLNGGFVNGLNNWYQEITLLPGSNVLSAVATDNEELTAIDTIVVYYNPDSAQTNIPPTISIENPYDGVTSSTAIVTISGIANDDVNLSDVKLNGQLTTGFNNWNLDYTLNVGLNVINAIATDNEDLTGTDSISIYYNPDSAQTNVPPVITIENPDSGVTSSTALVTISGIATDDINVAEVRLNGQLVTGINDWWVEYNLSLGANLITAVVTDNEGLTDTETISVFYDPDSPDTNVPPTISIVNPSDGFTSDFANITISGIADDDINLREVRINGSLTFGLENWSIEKTLAKGANVITAVATDNEGLTVSETITVFYSIPPSTNIPPTIIIQNPNDGATSSTALVTISGVAFDDVNVTNVTVNGNATDGLNNWSLDYSLSTGENIINAVVTDNDGLTGTDSISVFYNPNSADTNIPPTITIQNPYDGVTSSTEIVTISGIANDDVNLTSVTVNGDDAIGFNEWSKLFTLAPGSNLITSIATDNEGLTAINSITVYYVSGSSQTNIPPTISIQNPYDGVTSSTAIVTISGIANDDVNLSQLVVNDLLVSGLNNWNIKYMLDVGPNFIIAIATDNEGLTATDSITIYYNPDSAQTNVPPTVNILNPVDGATFNEPLITISGTANDDINLTQLKVNNQLAVGLNNWSIDYVLSLGTNIINAVVTDNEGLIGTDSITVIFDPNSSQTNIPPTIIIQNPPNGTISSTEIVTISGIASDDNSLTEVKVDNQLPDGLNNWKIECSLSIGTNVINAIATDNEELTASDSIIVIYNPDSNQTNVPPTIIIQSPYEGVTSSTELVTISGIASDDINLTDVRINGQLTTGLNNWNLNYSLNIGLNTITAIATDNEGLTATDSITVYYNPDSSQSNVPPVITIENPDAGVTSSTALVTISGIATDDINVAKVRVNGQLVTGINDWRVDFNLSLGANLITAVATDNEGLTDTESITVYYNPDSLETNVPPTISIISPFNGYTSDVAQISIGGIATDDINLRDVRVNGALTTGLENWQRDIILSFGLNIITAVATDNEGLTASHSISVYYPNTNAPSIMITAPVSSGLVYDSLSDYITVRGLVAFDKGVERVTVINETYGFSVPPIYTFGKTNYSFNAFGLRLGKGLNKIVATAYNSEGVSMFDTIYVTYGGDLNLEILSPTNEFLTYIAASPFEISGVVFDNSADIIDMYYTVVNENGEYSGSILNDYNWNANIPLYTVGTNLITISAENNYGEVVTDSITIDWVDMFVQIQSPTNADYYVSSQNTLSFSGIFKAPTVANGPVAISYSINGSSYLPVSSTGGDQWFIDNVTFSDQSDNSLSVRISDPVNVSYDFMNVFVRTSSFIYVEIQQPNIDSSTDQSPILLSGIVLASPGNVSSVSWTNHSANNVGGTFNFDKSDNVDWSGLVGLLPGLNNIEVFAVNEDGVVDTDSINVTWNVPTNSMITILAPLNQSRTTNSSVFINGLYDSSVGAPTIIWNNLTTGIAGDCNENLNDTFNGTSFIELEKDSPNVIKVSLIVNDVEIDTDSVTIYHYSPGQPLLHQIVDPTSSDSYQCPDNIPEFTLGVDSITDVTNITWYFDDNSPQNMTKVSDSRWTADVIAPFGNSILYTCASALGRTAEWDRLIVTYSTNPPPELAVLVNWPVFYEQGQTGYVEFVSTSGTSYDLKYLSQTGPVLASITAVGNQTTMEFAFDGAALGLNTDDINTNVILVLVADDGSLNESLPRPLAFVAPVPVATSKGKGKIISFNDFDGDEVTVSYKGAADFVMKGRSIFIDGGTVKDSVKVKVKPAKAVKGKSDARCKLDWIEAENLKSITWVGDIDDIQITNSLAMVNIKSGGLGFDYERRASSKHGLQSGADMKVVKIASSKSKLASKKVLGGYAKGEFDVGGSFAGKGWTLIISGKGNTAPAIVSADITTDKMKGVKIKDAKVEGASFSVENEISTFQVVGSDVEGVWASAKFFKAIKVPKNNIIDSKFYATGDDGKKGIGIGSIMANTIEDSNNASTNLTKRNTIFASGIIGNISSTNMTSTSSIKSLKTKTGKAQGVFSSKQEYKDKKVISKYPEYIKIINGEIVND